MNNLTYTALFPTSTAARAAVDSLIQAGVPANDIAVATRSPGAETVFGTAATVLPGQGPFGWKPLMVVDPLAAAGAFPQAFVDTVPDSDLASAFEGLGLSSGQAGDCADVLRHGGTVLHVSWGIPALSARSIEDILRASGAEVFDTPQGQEP